MMQDMKALEKDMLDFLSLTRDMAQREHQVKDAANIIPVLLKQLTESGVDASYQRWDTVSDAEHSSRISVLVEDGKISDRHLMLYHNHSVKIIGVTPFALSENEYTIQIVSSRYMDIAA